MNRWIFLSAILFSFSAYGASDGLRVLYGVDVFEGKDKRTHVTSEYLIQKGAVRFETKSPDLPAGDTVVIGRQKPKTSVLLFPGRKVYMEMPEAESKAPEGKPEPNVPFKSTGKTKEIAGYSCTVVAREMKDRREEACTSSKLMAEFKDLESALPRTKESRNAMPKGMDGFPLEYQVFKKAGGSTPDMTMRVEQLKREKFDAALFEIPAGYQKQEFPKMDARAMQEMMKNSKRGAANMPKDMEEKMKQMQKMMNEGQQ